MVRGDHDDDLRLVRKTNLLGYPRPNLQELLEIARDESVVLRLADGGSFLLAEIDDFEDEIRRTRDNERLMRLLDRRSAEQEIFTLEQVREQLDLR